jgi:hypothetical protein
MTPLGGFTSFELAPPVVARVGVFTFSPKTGLGFLAVSVAQDQAF